jgi:transcriptional regulator with XRE-family HTH domain
MVARDLLVVDDAHMARPRKSPLATAEGRQAIWTRAGAFIKQRREALGLTQRQVMKALGYATPVSVSNIERGAEGVQLKRSAAWADLLELPRDAFLLFVTGERATFSPTSAPAAVLGPVEREIVDTFSRLSPKYQERLLQNVREYDALTRVERRGAKR